MVLCTVIVEREPVIDGSKDSTSAPSRPPRGPLCWACRGSACPPSSPDSVPAVLVAAAVCPHPPLLVPRVAGQITGDLDACRAACAQVIDDLLAARPDLLVVLGGGPQTREHQAGSRGSLDPYGVEMTLGEGEGPRSLPLSLGIGTWLLGERNVPRVTFQEIATTAAPEEAAAIGAGLGPRSERVAALVMTDGSAYLSQTPVGDDGRGDRYDERWMGALERADVADMLALDPADDAALWTTGRSALQALAGAVRESTGTWRTRIAWRGAPYGVGYVVASLTRT
jgi:hypothetical protein